LAYPPAGAAVVAMTAFTGYRGRYVFHCHNVEHEDMMANLEVV
jgi:spore coat protein A